VKHKLALLLIASALCIGWSSSWHIPQDLPKFRVNIVSKFLVNPDVSEVVQVAKLNENLIAVAYDTNDDAKVKTLLISNNGKTITDVDATFGSTDCQVGTNPYETPISICVLDTTRFVFSYVEDGSADDLYATVCSVDSSGIITEGAEAEIANTDAEFAYLVALTSETFVAVFNDESNGSIDVASAVACTVSGTTITVGSITELNATDWYPRQISATRINDTTLICAFRAVDEEDGWMVPMTVNKLVITPGTPYEFDTVGNGGWSSIKALGDTGNFMVGWDTRVAIGSTDGATVTMGTTQTALLYKDTWNVVLPINNDLVAMTMLPENSRTIPNSFIGLASVDMANKQVKSLIERQHTDLTVAMSVGQMTPNICNVSGNLYCAGVQNNALADTYVIFFTIDMGN
jgi:hypothetical protein